MKKNRWHLLVTLLLALGYVGAWAAEEGALDEGLTNPGYVQKPAWFKNSFLDLREDLAEAVAARKRVILYFYQDGCPYCEKLINTNFSQRDIAEKTRKNFDLVAINMWGDTTVTDLQGNEMSEKQFAKKLRVQFTPTLLFLDETGKAVLRANGYYPPHKFIAALDYVAQRREGKERFADFLAARTTKKASGQLHRADTYLQAPYELRRRPGAKPLLVLFEQRECAACDELHNDALAREESVELLKAFDIVLLDLWSKETLTTPDGRRRAINEWARELAVQYTPSMLFFDAAGREVFRSEAYLRPFHTQAALAYVATGAYRNQPEFQRFVQERADTMRGQGLEVDLWN